MSSYNCRLYEYPVGTHVTFYDKTILNNKNDIFKILHNNFKKSYHNEERTELQEKHCIEQSANASKNKIYNIARSNEWEWFITLTFDREKVDSSNYDEVTKKLQKFLNHLKERYSPDLKYLIVPELHKDKLHYHFHGILANTGSIRFLPSGHYTDDNEKIYNIKNWSFGFTTATRVKDSQRVSSYITKYISKDLCFSLKNKKRYYVSRNINVTEPVYGVCEKKDIYEYYEDDITFIKNVTIPKAGQNITYFEIKK